MIANDQELKVTAKQSSPFPSGDRLVRFRCAGILYIEAILTKDIGYTCENE
jgi:hypothetical protein